MRSLPVLIVHNSGPTTNQGIFFLEIKHNDFEFFVFLLDAEVNGEIL